MKTGSGIQAASFYRGLLYASLAYLALPLLVFLFAYMASPAGIGLGGAVLAALLLTYRALSRAKAVTGATPTRRELALLVLFVLLWAATTGMGGVGFQEEDWEKHNAVLYTLTTHPWPVGMAYEGTALALAYYTGFPPPSSASSPGGRRPMPPSSTSTPATPTASSSAFWRTAPACRIHRLPDEPANRTPIQT